MFLSYFDEGEGEWMYRNVIVEETGGNVVGYKHRSCARLNENEAPLLKRGAGEVIEERNAKKPKL